MTETTSALPKASFAEDFVDIFYAPSAVFERRREASPWPAILVVTGLFIIASYISLSLLAPVVELQMNQQMAEMQRQNPNLTSEQLAGMQRFGRIMLLAGAAVAVPLTVVVLGLVSWLLGKLFGAEQPLRAAFLVVAFSWMPRVVETILTALQSFVLDVNAIPSIYAASLSPARFMPADSSMMVLALLTRLSPFVIWSYVLLAIGLKVTGRISGQKAAIAAVILWLLGSIPTAMQGMGGGTGGGMGAS